MKLQSNLEQPNPHLVQSRPVPCLYNLKPSPSVSVDFPILRVFPMNRIISYTVICVWLQLHVIKVHPLLHG